MHMFVTECRSNENQTRTHSLQLFSNVRAPQGAFKNHSHKAKIVFIFPKEVTELSACIIQDSWVPLSCFARNTSKPPTEAESQTPKSGLTQLDSWPYCQAAVSLHVFALLHGIGESIIGKVHEQRGHCIFSRG